MFLIGSLKTIRQVFRAVGSFAAKTLETSVRFVGAARSLVRKKKKTQKGNRPVTRVKGRTRNASGQFVAGRRR